MRIFSAQENDTPQVRHRTKVLALFDNGLVCAASALSAVFRSPDYPDGEGVQA